MLEEIKGEAARLDRSLSWVVQLAWKKARLEIKKMQNANDRGSGGSKLSLYLPEAMVTEIKGEAARLHHTLSGVVQLAWKKARLEIKKMQKDTGA